MRFKTNYTGIEAENWIEEFKAKKISVQEMGEVILRCKAVRNTNNYLIPVFLSCGSWFSVEDRDIVFNVLKKYNNYTKLANDYDVSMTKHIFNIFSDEQKEYIINRWKSQNNSTYLKRFYQLFDYNKFIQYAEDIIDEKKDFHSKSYFIKELISITKDVSLKQKYWNLYRKDFYKYQIEVQQFYEVMDDEEKNLLEQKHISSQYNLKRLMEECGKTFPLGVIINTIVKTQSGNLLSLPTETIEQLNSISTMNALINKNDG